jgi:15,16-dihydrobiliverdin:ferredoxin oxidoreductase
MKAMQVLLFTPAVACAYTLHHQPRNPSFAIGRDAQRKSRAVSSSSQSLYRSDADTSTLDVLTTAMASLSKKLPLMTQSPSLKEGLKPSKRSRSVREAEAEHGMPWKSSIDTNVEDELLYMPFWEWQMDFMEENLTDLQVIECKNDKDTDFSFNSNEKKKARIVNVCFSSKEYSKIRMTYYDAGDNTQVYNAVWYPNPEYNLPVLGIDLLAFNRKKYLAIVDFQPIHDEEKDHASTYEHLLKPIKEQYDSLKGRMSSKFYDETQHFSEQMLFARFDDESVIERDLFPAFQGYVQTHLDLIRSTEPKPEETEMVTSKIKAYDT